LGKTSINIKSNQKDETNDAEPTTGSPHGGWRAQRPAYFKHAIDGFISPQGANTAEIHFSVFILPAIKSNQLARR